MCEKVGLAKGVIVDMEIERIVSKMSEDLKGEKELAGALESKMTRLSTSNSQLADRCKRFRFEQ